MAYDPSLGVTVLFGGHEETSDYGDTWEWNGIPWTLNPSAGSTPRSGMPMAFDSGRNVTVMFGGLGTQYLDDTWEYGPAGQDCNANQIPDECDIAAGISTDCQPDGIPDECTCLTMSAAQPEPVVQAKNRYLAFDPNNECVKAAIRVTFTDLPPPFEALEDQRRWVGPPVETCEDALVVSAPCLRGSFTLASLQCESFFTDWGPWGLLHVTGPEIVPNATYTVELVHEGCDIANNADYSTGLPVPTIGKWADVVPAFGGPTQPNFADIAAVTDKFRDAPSAVSKARTDLVANVPDRKVNFSDIAAATDAFRGFPYPFTGPASCP